MTPLISFSTLACPDWSWSEIVQRGREYGYDGVEVRLIERDTDLLNRPEFAPEALDERRRELADAGFQVCGLASSVQFDSPDPEERARQVQVGVGYVELARALGGGFVRVFGDVLPADATGAERNKTLGRIAWGLQRLGELAEPIGVDVLIETHGDFCDSRLMQALLARVTSPRVGVVWDTHHPWRYFDEPIAETFARLAPWVRHTHWKDSVALSPRELSEAERAAAEQARQIMSGHRDADFVLFGEGEFPAAQCLQVLSATGYTGWYSYEWEKAWHPAIAPPELALPPFPAALRRMMA